MKSVICVSYCKPGLGDPLTTLYSLYSKFAEPAFTVQTRSAQAQPHTDTPQISEITKLNK